MLELIVKIISSLIINAAITIIISKITDRKVKVLDLKNILLFLTLVVTTIIFYRVKYDFSITLLNFLFLVLVYKEMFNISVTKSIVVNIFMLIIIALAEIVSSIIIIIFFKLDIDTIRKMYYLSIFINFGVGVIAILMANIKIINNKIRELIFWTNDRKYFVIVPFFIAEIIAICMIFSKIGSDFHNNYNFLLNISIILLFMFVFLIFVHEKTKYNKLTNDYETLFNHAQIIEECLDKQRIQNHENKNQLIVIRDLAPKNSKKLLNYIDNILNEPPIVDYEWLSKLKNIPAGGLKGLIYYKIKQMQKEDINISLDVSKGIDKKDFKDLSPDHFKHLCIIMGVYLDNAIDATKKCDNDNRQIGLEVYKRENNITITISNTYKGPLILEELDDTGFSTKGEGRGYGLSLAKSILSNHKLFSQHREIVNNCYVQHLIINLEK